MLKAITPVFAYLTGNLMGIQTWSLRLFKTIVSILNGIMSTSVGELRFGLFVGFLTTDLVCPR